MKDEPKKILVLHGPNLNLLGSRQPELYGTVTLKEINSMLEQEALKLNLKLETFQSNVEGDLVTRIQDAAGKAHGILINAAAYTHTSIALGDALAAVGLPAVEVHLTNTQARESFRRHSKLAAVVGGRIEGFGMESYRLGLRGLASLLETNHERSGA